ncbi:hypothetical protein KUCAC02_010693 [Chaenocephalus aceratus]|uniref:Uncharacterized protein n=1 Tax=Chaenocephalus aceratus TaxID=36190 RepID=A0ACB9W1R6_CHAAC|nr:hypothetical protein KUCAC02_010693 [Chaenocephalus aceratus]
MAPGKQHGSSSSNRQKTEVSAVLLLIKTPNKLLCKYSVHTTHNVQQAALQINIAEEKVVVIALISHNTLH